MRRRTRVVPARVRRSPSGSRAWLAATRHVRAPRAQEPGTLENVLVFSKTGGFRHDSIPQGITAIQQLGAANGFTVTATEDSDGVHRRRTSRTSTSSSSSRRPARCSTTRSRRRSSATSSRAAATPASTPPPTRSTRGRGTASWSAATSARTPPERRPRRSTSRTPTSPPRPACRRRWTRVDEWYNFQHPTTPAVNGSATIADYSPRARHVKVLATVDESTYGEDDGNTRRRRPPGRLVLRLRRRHLVVHGDGPHAGLVRRRGLPRPPARRPADGRRRAGDCGEPALDAAGRRGLREGHARRRHEGPDGDRRSPTTGARSTSSSASRVTGGQANQAAASHGVGPDRSPVGRGHDPRPTDSTRTACWASSSRPTSTSRATSTCRLLDAGRPSRVQAKVNRISRFTTAPTTRRRPARRSRSTTGRHQRAECCHTGGSLDFGPDGSLYLSTGDNTNPFAHGFNPTDERPGRQNWDAQRTSANTNNPNGKILRIVPIAACAGSRPTRPASGRPTRSRTATCSRPGTAQTLPEIYAMGFRNPFRIHVDQETGWVLMGDYGPDAGSTNPTRGPQGSVEFNVVKEPGFYGWPYCVRENVPYHDITYAADDGNAGTDNGLYNCAAPVNNSPNNTGLTEPAAGDPGDDVDGLHASSTRASPTSAAAAPRPAARATTTTRTATSDDEVPARSTTATGSSASGTTTGSRRRRSTTRASPPASSCFAICAGYISPMDIEFGPERLDVRRRVGPGLRREQPRLGRLPGRLRPGRAASRSPARPSTPTPCPCALTVNFSSAGSDDPDGTAITYAVGLQATATRPPPPRTRRTPSRRRARTT